MSLVPGINHIELASGAYVDLADPDPSAIELEDIAHGLAHLCRFAGQCRIFYSVAEHARVVAYRLQSLGYDRDVCLAGLHHDDAEALCCDIPRPLKKMLPKYQRIEATVFAAVVEALGLSGLPFDNPAIKEADDWALQREAYDLLPSRGEHWHGAIDQPGGPPPWTLGASPRSAKRSFLAEHRRLSRVAVAA